MRVRNKRFEARLSETDRVDLRELGKLLCVSDAEAIRLAVAEKLRRVRAKQKAQPQAIPSDTEAA